MNGTKRLTLHSSAAIAALAFSSVLYAATGPAVPVLSSPVDNAPDLDTSSIPLVWNTPLPSDSIISFTVQVSRDSTFTTLISPDTPFVTAATQGIVYRLLKSSRYYWHVRATNINGTSAWSTPRWSFVTHAVVPPAPVLNSPLDTGTALNTVLQWNAAVGAWTYRVQLSTDPAFTTWIFSDSLLAPTTSRAVTLSDNGRTYFWRVYAWNSAGRSAWSKGRFTTVLSETYASWSYHRDLVVNTTALNNGAGVQNRVYNFPVLVRLSPSNFGWFDSTLAGGVDIRFARSNGAKALPYEIERWVVGGGRNDTAEIWVLLDTVKGNDTTHITMYWGNAGAQSRSNPYRVFDPAAGFSHVWHMNDSAGTGTIKDRTNGCNGTRQGTVPPVSFIAGSALDFNGGYLSLDTVRTSEFTAGATVSAWVRYHNPLPANAYILGFSKSSATARNKVALGNAKTSAPACRWTTGRDSASASNCFVYDTTIYVAATYSRSTLDSLAVYKNGSILPPARSFTAGNGFQLDSASDSTLGLNFIGRNDSAGVNFSGYMDEVQVSRIARDSNWIKLAYQTQRFGQTALCYYPSISQQPANDTAGLPATAQFSVTARGNNLSYLWQRSDNGGSTWGPVSGTAALYSFTTSSADTGLTSPRFRCIVSSPYYSDTSAAAVLTVCIPTVITKDPSPRTAFPGDVANFNDMTVSGRNLTYLWQSSWNNGAWAPASGTNNLSTYQFTTTATDTAWRFRCIVSGMSGVCTSQATSGPAALKLCTHITFTTPSPHDMNGIAAGAYARCTVSVNPGRFIPKYQWYKKKLPAPWPGTFVNSATTPFLNYPTDTSGIDSGTIFRCLVTSDTCEPLGVWSDSAWLRGCSPARVTSDPRDTNVALGSTATFYVVATGASPTYLWQRSDDTGKNWDTAKAPRTNPSYSLTATASDTGIAREFRCKVSSACGPSSATSNFARVIGCAPAAIPPSGQPLNNSTLGVIDGSPATLRVVATGTNPSYQWQRGPSWTPVGTNSSYSFTATYPADSGVGFRCQVSTSGTCTFAVTSDTVTLAVYRRVALTDTTYPRNDTVVGGDRAIFTIHNHVTGSNPGYRWQRSRNGGGIWDTVPGAHYSGRTIDSLILSQADTLDTNALFRCLVIGHYLYATPPSDTDTTRSAKFTICFMPKITASGQPQNQSNIPPGGWADFQVTAQTIGTPSYQWERSILFPYTVYTAIPGANASIYSHQVVSGENNYHYRCVVRSGTCTNPVTSSAGILTVCALPVIDTQPASRGAIEGDTAVRFRVAASGTGLQYQWQQRKSYSPWTDIFWDTSAATAALHLPAVTPNDSDLDYFRCLVKVACYDTTDTSTEAFLRVYPKAHAYFTMSDISGTGPWLTTDTLSISDSGQVPLYVFFLDSSYGDIDRCIWNFGDTSKPDTAGPSHGIVPNTHIYANTLVLKTYRVTLVVSGNGGRDTLRKTVFIYPKSANPVTISGWYVAPDTVRLGLHHYNSPGLTTNTGYASYVVQNGIRVWYQKDSLPADTLPPAQQLKAYDLDSLRKWDSSGNYYENVVVPRLTGQDSVYGFMTQLVWNDHIPPFDSGNGCRVLMRDTMPPPNNIQLASKFLAWDTALFRFIDTKVAIDTSKVDSVGRWWGESDLPPDFSDTAHTKWWSAAQFINKSVDTTIWGTTTGMFNDTVKNARFNTPTRKMFAFVLRLRSKYNKWTDKSDGIMIGRTPPNTTIKFTAEAQSASIVHLTWKWDTLIFNPDSVRVDSFRIWYAADTAVPLDYRFDTAIYKRIIPEPGISDKERWVSGLQENTPYYFGAQVFLGSSLNSNFQAGLWSMVTPVTPVWLYTDTSTIPNVEVYDTMVSIDSAMTWSHDSSRIRNTIHVDAVVVTPATLQAQVFWHVDLMGYDSLFLGISYNLRNATPLDTVIARLQSRDSTLPANGVTISANTDTGSYVINLDQRNISNDKGSLFFDTTYYVMLWLKKSGEKWGPPTDSSVSTFYVPPFAWQSTQYTFKMPYPTDDTTYWANGMVRFVAPVNKGNIQVTARIRLFTPNPASLSGFVTNSQGFSFMDRKGSPDLQVGLKYNLPGLYYNSQDVRVYRWDGTSGQWKVQRNTVIDSADSYACVTVKSDDLVLPFIVMIDTQPPIVTYVPNSQVLQPWTMATDTFGVSDNVGNLVWSFYRERGEKNPALWRTATLTNGIDTVGTVIDTLYTSPENGARALFIADDGRFRDTENISRKVYRDSTLNILRSYKMKWRLIHLTFGLDSTSITRLWRYVPGANDKYDTKQIRLFRFLSDVSNITKPLEKRWLEYAPGRESLFELKAGRLYWIKTREDITYNLGPGYTLPLQNNDTLVVQSEGWTDFALPHMFDMRIGDILDYNYWFYQGTQVAFRYIPTSEWYEWKMDDTTGTYRCVPLYIVGLTGSDSLSRKLLCLDASGYTIYNNAGTSFTLFIPPKAAAMSTHTLDKKAVTAAATAWALKLQPRTDQGALLSPVFCGYNSAIKPGGGFYHMPPSWSSLSVGVYDEKSQSVWGHRMLRELRDGGASFMLAFRNDTACGRSISVKAERVAAFPDSMKVSVYDPVSGQTKLLASADDKFTVAIDGGATAYRWVFVGDATYVASAVKNLSVLKLGLERVYPNPARGPVRLRYSLPFALGKVRFTILDISGRTIWSRTIEENSPMGGSRECLWDGTSNAGRRIAAGVFIVRMEAFDQKDRLAGAFNKRLTFLP